MKIASVLPASTESELEQQIRRASRIARLVLSEDELKGLLRDAEAIFGEFSKIQEIELPDSVETGAVTVAAGSLREDIAEKFPDADRIFACVPKKEGRLVLAPKSL